MCVTAGTNSSELSRFNTSELRSHSNINIKNYLYESNFKYRNFDELLVLIVFLNLYYHNDILSLPKINFFNKYKIHTITNTNSNHLVTIDDNYVPKDIGNNKLVRNDGVLDPDNPNSPTSITNNTSSILLRVDFNIYSSNISTCVQICNVFPNLLISEPSINTITVHQIIGAIRL